MAIAPVQFTLLKIRIQRYLIAFFMIFFSFTISAQPLIEWSKGLGGTLNDIPHASINNPDGSFVIAGQSTSSDQDIDDNKGGFDLWITKLDNGGNLVWEKNYGGSADEYALDLQQTADGGYILTGGTGSNDNDINENFGKIDLWVLKLDAAGDLEWSKTFGGAGIDIGTGLTVLSDGYMIAGCTGSAGEPNISPGYGGNEYWVLKIDFDGNLIWEKTYGGKRHDAAKSILPTADGGFIIGGNTWSADGDIISNHGHSDAWIIKIDASGLLQWSKTYGGETADHMNSLTQSDDGNYTLAGSRGEMDFINDGLFGRYDEQFWILKFDPSGQQIWEKTYGGENYDEATSIETTIDGGYIIGGWVRSVDGQFFTHKGNKDAWFVKTNAAGEEEWSQLMGGAENEIVKSITQANDGGYLMVGYSNSIFIDTIFNKKGFEDWWVVKFGGSAVNVDIGDNITVCKNEPFTLDAYISTCDCTYLWSDGSTDSIRQLTLTETTPFSVTVTDEAGLEGIDMATVFVSTPQVDVNAQDVQCNGYGSGFLGLIPYGAFYTYEWSTGETTQDIFNLQPGTYTYTVTDGSGCTLVDEAIIMEPAPISIADNITEIDCYGGSTGSIDLTVDGGVGGFEYEWSSSEMTQDIYNLTTGGYTVTITDGNGCIRVQDWVVNQPPTIDVGVSLIPTLCFDSENGGAQINTNGGVGNFTYEWSNGQMTENLTNVGTGTYTLTVTDGNNCEVIEIVQVSAPNEIIIQETVLDATCAGNNNGTITTSVTGGSGQHQYHWSTGATTPNISQLSSGTYSLTVTDGNGCEKIKEMVVSQNTDIQIAAMITEVSCYEIMDGAIDINVNGGAGGFTYEWNTGQTTQDLTGINGGGYIVTVTDNNGCEEVQLFIIDTPDSISLVSVVVEPNCFGNSDGMIATTAAGGNGGFEYSWDNSTDGPMLEMISAGVYTLTVTDAMGCELVESYTLTEPEELVINSTVSDVSCFDGNDGAIEVDISGGVGGYMIDWSTGANSDLTTGNYNIIVTDMNNCVVTQNFFIDQPDIIEVTIQSTNPINGNDGAISATATGGTPPYDFSWNDGALMGTELSDLIGGTYDLVMTDGNGCTYEQTVVLQTTSTTDLKNLQKFEIFPNPNDGTFFLQLEFEKRENIEIVLTNELGQTLQSFRRDGDYFLEKNTMTQLSAGIYFIMVKTENGVAVKRLLVQ